MQTLCPAWRDAGRGDVATPKPHGSRPIGVLMSSPRPRGIPTPSTSHQVRPAHRGESSRQPLPAQHVAHTPTASTDPRLYLAVLHAGRLLAPPPQHQPEDREQPKCAPPATKAAIRPATASKMMTVAGTRTGRPGHPRQVRPRPCRGGVHPSVVHPRDDSHPWGDHRTTTICAHRVEPTGASPGRFGYPAVMNTSGLTVVGSGPAGVIAAEKPAVATTTPCLSLS